MSSNYTAVSVGLPFIPDFETLNIEVPLQTGTIQGNKVKIGNVTFRVINSKGGWIGPNSSTLHEALDYATLEAANGGTLGSSSLYTGDIRVPLGAGYERGGRVFYRQIDPLPISITDVIPEFSYGEMKSA